MACFLSEAQDLLQTIEPLLMDLQRERTTARVHELMRAAHTLKGAAASVGQRAIQEVSHVLEDIFRALYNPDLAIDAEVEALLFEGYACLRRPIIAALHDESVDESEVMNRAAEIIARLQEKFGDAFDPDAFMPTSAELGFDMVQSMFEMGVTQQLNTLRAAIQEQDAIALAETLQTQAELFLGFAESLNLQGFGEIAQTTLMALRNHPDQVTTIAHLALEDFWAGRERVLTGDRTEGGKPSASLQRLAGIQEKRGVDAPIHLDDRAVDAALEAALDQMFTEEPNDPFPFPDMKQAVSPFHSATGQDAPDLPFRVTDAAATQPSEPELDNLLDAELVAALSGLEEAMEMTVDMAPAELSPGILADTEIFDAAMVPAISPSRTRPAAAPGRSQTQPLDPAIAPPASPETFGNGAIAAKAQATIRVALDRLDNLNHFIGELLINQNRQTTQDDVLRAHVQTLVEGLRRHQQRLHAIQDWADQWLIQTAAQSVRDVPMHLPVEQGLGRSALQVQRGSLSRSLALPRLLAPSRLTSSLASFDALEMDRYSGLHSLVQEALADFSPLETTAETLRQLSKKTHHTTQAQQRLLTHIRDDLTDVRMAPLEGVFTRFPSMLQRLAETHGKPVRLQWTGGDVLVDKAIAEKLYDPLLHLIRNAFDHGIEAAAARQANSKPPQGHIQIEAYHQGRYTVIEVSDDGNGIDPHHIRQQVLRAGLATADTLSRYTDHQVLTFLFEPGFSTRQHVSDLSGRGMGLDIVRSQLTAMNGSVQIQSRPGYGTTFTLSIPISLTISKMLVCRSGSTAYALPVQRIERLLLPKPNTYKIHARRRALQLFEDGYESLIPLRSLQELLPYSRAGYRVAQARYAQGKGSDRPIEDATPYILLLQSKQQRWALQVEAILGEQELVVRPLTTMNPPDYIYGGAILGDNDVALAIDPDVLLQLETGQSRTPTVETPAAQLAAQASPRLLPAAPPPSAPSLPSPSKRHILLVVDDSLTQRQILTRTLEARGYGVIQAQDGQDAIQKLHGHPQIDLVLCDIEMPRLNGFEFLTYSRQHPDFAKIPIVMLTSRTTQKHRQLALGLGATDYITKPYSEPQLLSTLEQTLKDLAQNSL